MVRAGDLTKAALVALAITAATPACAERALDWYIDLKREAKFARIASARGARPSEMRPYIEATERLIRRIDDWDAAEKPKFAARPCLEAAQGLLRALYAIPPSTRESAINAGETTRDGCRAAIQGR